MASGRRIIKVYVFALATTLTSAKAHALTTKRINVISAFRTATLLSAVGKGQSKRKRLLTARTSREAKARARIKSDDSPSHRMMLIPSRPKL